jgi:crotonobetainyl-CoA:carnitine CoA-transferase CaiB-like acyl-CoA transferase
MKGPLEHIRVLDLTIARAGPMAVRVLADWGANVIKIEPPPRKDAQGNSVTGGRRGPDEQNLHRNKRSLAIDLKHKDGKALFHRLAKDADVVVENFRSSVKYRLGVDYETLKAINPRLIYASISGFGQDGPDSERPGVDQIIQGMSGLMSITGEPTQGPMRAGIAISDTSAGMFLGQGILLALLHRERTGRGQWVHTSLLEAMISKLDFQGARYTMSGEEPTQQGNDHPTQVPMGMFEAKDGYVNIAAFGGQMWQRFCQALNANSLFDHPDYRSVGSRSRHRDQIKADMNAITTQYPVAELVQRLNEAGVPCGPINTVKEAFENPQVTHLGMSVSVSHEALGEINLVRSPINLSDFPHPAKLSRGAPDPGADGDDVLAELGFRSDEIAALQRNEVIS